MTKQYWVGEFFVDLSRNQISQHYQSQNLPPKALLVLTYLAENPGKVISYDELLDRVWPNSIVTPNTLQRSIAQLRKALGENSKAQGLIKTHAKQGYSLECEVVWSEDGKPSAMLVTEEDTESAERHGTHEPSYNEQNSDEPSHHEQSPIAHSFDRQAFYEEDQSARSPKNASLKRNDHPELVTESPENLNDPHSPETKSHNSVHSVKAKTSSKYRSVALAASFLVIALTLVLFQFQSKEPVMHIGDLRYLTATDDKEYGGTYSPDGNYIIFHRYFDPSCINGLWAKNATTMEEVQLTREMASYGIHSMSPDGKNLAFIKQEDCSKPVEQNVCYTLMKLDFMAALSEPQLPQELLVCKHSAIRKPVWTDNQHIALLQNNEQNWRLVKFSLQDSSVTELFSLTDGNIISFDWSMEQQVFAVTSRRNDGHQYVDILHPDGSIKSNNQITFPADLPRHLTARPEFVPGNEQLIFGDGTHLYTLNYNGQVQKADFQTDGNAGSPFFHPNGKSLLLIAGRYDSDIARLAIPDPDSYHSINDPKAEFSSFERSINAEDRAKFQPNGDLIAFESARTGSSQVWLLENGQPRLLSDFPSGAYVDNLLWNTAGDSLLVQAGMELHQLSLEQTMTTYDFPYPVVRLFHWDSEANQAIANVNINGKVKFVEIDLTNQSHTIINQKQVFWAAKNANGPLVFSDHLARFWQKTDVENKLLEPLTGQLGMKQRFVLHEEMIYGINKEDQLWSYHLPTDNFKILANMTSDIDYLTDANNNELLLSFVIAAKKEVVELSIAQ